jgi:hypothetical protein
LADVAPESPPLGNPIFVVIRSFLIRVFAVCLLLWVALFNGYPTVFSDTGSYIITGRTLIAFPPFRSPGYSIFTRLTSLGISGWLVVVAQSIIVVYLLDKTFEYLISDDRRHRDTGLLATVSILAAFTSLPWEVSLLMPDVFAGTVFLSAFLLAFNDRMRLADRIFLAVILLISAGSHSSLLPIATLFVAALILVRVARRQLRVTALRRAVLASLVVPLIAAGLSTATLNYRMHLGFKFAPSGQLFMLARLFGDGLAADFLRANCPSRPFTACRYLSSLPRTPEEFLFENSPLQKELEGNRNEENEIVYGTLSAYKLRFLTSSIKDTFLQFAAFRTGDEIRSYRAQTWNVGAVTRIFPGDLKAFLHSKESRDRLLPLADAAATVHTVTFWLSLATCLAFACTSSLGPLTRFFYSAMAFLVINAAVSATFAGVFDRYQSRVAWIVPLCATAYICNRAMVRRRPTSFSPGR